jgi:hypothetical protein
MSFLKNFCATSFVCALISVPVAASASTYYVSQSNGSDSNNGLTEATAFKTIAKVNALKNLKGGDAVLLRRGDVWHEQLVIPGSGTSTRSRLTIDAYGSGAKPTIDGADVVTGWSLTSAGTYQTRRTTPSYKVFVDALYKESTPLKLQTSVTSTINTPGSFYRDEDTLYIHLADGSDPAKHAIEVSGTGHQNGIIASNKSYVTVQNLQIVRTTNSGVAFVLDGPNTLGTSGNQNNTLSGLTIFNTGSTAPMPFGFDGGIMVRGNASGSSLGLQGWLILKNSIGRLDSPVGLNYNIGGIQLRGLKGATVMNNSVQTTSAMGIQDRPYGSSVSCGANLFRSNSMANNEGNISAEDAYDIVTYNKVVNSRGFGIQVQSYGYVEGNLVAHLKTSTDGKLYNGIDGAGGANALYSNNNIMDVDGCSLTVEGAAIGVKVAGGTYDASRGGQCALYTTASAGKVSFDGKTKWIAPATAAFRYLMTSAGDRAHSMTLTSFIAATSK